MRTTTNRSPLEGETNRMEDIHKKKNPEQTRTDMSPADRDKKMLAFMKQLPQFIKASVERAENEQKLISMR